MEIDLSTNLISCSARTDDEQKYSLSYLLNLMTLLPAAVELFTSIKTHLIWFC